MPAPINSTQPSPMSGNPSELIFSHDVLGKYNANYYFDEVTSSIFVDDPFWLEEAYSSAIAITDTGMLGRNERNTEIVSRAILASRYPFERGIDLGGGHGLFVRAMRDAGFDFYWTDKYAENLFARGFEAPPGQYGIATAFEVLEHVHDPLGFIKEAQERFGFDTLFFSATCFNQSSIPDTDWWYWAFETGQHISFFSNRTLQWMASELSMKLFHIRDDVFVFSKSGWVSLKSKAPRKQITGLLIWLLSFVQKGGRNAPPSLTNNDHLLLRDHLRKSASSKIRASK